MAKRRGHSCWQCGRRRPNEAFSGGGHARHLCKECRAELRRERRAEARRAAGIEPPARCAHCGAERALTVAGCCGQLYCDDREEYTPFAPTRSRCYRIHRCGANRPTPASADAVVRRVAVHPGLWEAIGEEQPVARWDSLAPYEEGWTLCELERMTAALRSGPCARCAGWIRLESDAWSIGAGVLWCADCTREELGDGFSLSNEIGKRGQPRLLELIRRPLRRERRRCRFEEREWRRAAKAGRRGGRRARRG